MKQAMRQLGPMECEYNIWFLGTKCMVYDFVYNMMRFDSIQSRLLSLPKSKAWLVSMDIARFHARFRKNKTRHFIWRIFLPVWPGKCARQALETPSPEEGTISHNRIGDDLQLCDLS